MAMPTMKDVQGSPLQITPSVENNPTLSKQDSISRNATMQRILSVVQQDSLKLNPSTERISNLSKEGLDSEGTKSKSIPLDSRPNPHGATLQTASTSLPNFTLESNNTLPPVYKVPSLFPAYFTYAVQHVILVKVQELLEECCFDFAKRWIPSLLVHTGWETAAAGELSEWPSEIRKYLREIPPSAIDLPNPRSLYSIFNDVRSLRNIAVHRSRERAEVVLDLIRKGLLLTKTLKDSPRITQLENILQLATSSLRELESGKNNLEDRIEERLQECQNEKDKLYQSIAQWDVKARCITDAVRGEDTGQFDLRF